MAPRPRGDPADKTHKCLLSMPLRALSRHTIICLFVSPPAGREQGSFSFIIPEHHSSPREEELNKWPLNCTFQAFPCYVTYIASKSEQSDKDFCDMYIKAMLPDI